MKYARVSVDSNQRAAVLLVESDGKARPFVVYEGEDAEAKARHHAVLAETLWRRVGARAEVVAAARAFSAQPRERLHAALLQEVLAVRAFEEFMARPAMALTWHDRGEGGQAVEEAATAYGEAVEQVVQAAYLAAEVELDETLDPEQWPAVCDASGRALASAVTAEENAAEQLAEVLALGPSATGCEGGFAHWRYENALRLLQARAEAEARHGLPLAPPAPGHGPEHN